MELSVSSHPGFHTLFFLFSFFFYFPTKFCNVPWKRQTYYSLPAVLLALIIWWCSCASQVITFSDFKEHIRNLSVSLCLEEPLNENQCWERTERNLFSGVSGRKINNMMDFYPEVVKWKCSIYAWSPQLVHIPLSPTDAAAFVASCCFESILMFCICCSHVSLCSHSLTLLCSHFAVIMRLLWKKEKCNSSPTNYWCITEIYVQPDTLLLPDIRILG